MMLGSRAFYAVKNGTIFAFQSKRQRDNCGGTKISAKDVYGKHKGNYVPVWFWQYENWMVKHGNL